MKRYIIALAGLILVELAKAGVIKGVLKAEDGTAIKNQSVYLNTGNTTKTDNDGGFIFNHVLKGKFELKTEFGGQLIALTVIELANATDTVDLGSVTLAKNIQLNQAEVKDNALVRTIERMPEVKDNVIYAGKKTEVVKLQASTANLAQNNSRQIFAKVPGIQVWESDGSGVQMGIAARGLSPNRMWEFNTRQNGYDISADPFGYPEAYYTPSVESLERIEIIRGAASLQYGPQFGGVVNYIKKRSVSGKKFGVESMQTLGNYGMFSSFNAIGGNVGNLSYYTNVNYRQSNGWRQNNDYKTWNVFANVSYQLTKKINISAEYTHMDQLVHQPGGLTDSMFKANSQQSVRERNWFNLLWNIGSVNFNYQINAKQNINVKAFVLNGTRSSIGFMSAINVPDTMDADGKYKNRTIDEDTYNNLGLEARYLINYNWLKFNHHLAIGMRAYSGKTDRIQNKYGNRQSNYDLTAERDTLNRNLHYKTGNLAVFAENVFNIGSKLSITPGIRVEWLNNTAHGLQDGKPVDRSSDRNFALLGLGAQYKVTGSTQFYANFSQAYRPITFSDLTVVTTDSLNPNLKDAKGYNLDLGYRGQVANFLNFDASWFYLNYANRVGTYAVNGKNYRTNIGNSVSKGVEAYVEFLPTALIPKCKFGVLNLFASIAFIDATYTSWNDPDATKNLKGKKVENAPQQIHRFGLTYRYKKFTTTLQHSYTAEAYADALNTKTPTATATAGLIPSYQITDWSFNLWLPRGLSINGGINNVFDKAYFTRRAGGYPGPGLMPAEGRLMYVGVGIKF